MAQGAAESTYHAVQGAHGIKDHIKEHLRSGMGKEAHAECVHGAAWVLATFSIRKQRH